MKVMHRLSASLPPALPASVNHQQLSTANQAGINNYHPVPVTHGEGRGKTGRVDSGGSSLLRLKWQQQERSPGQTVHKLCCFEFIAFGLADK